MASIISRVVDQHINCAEFRNDPNDPLHAVPQGVNVREITVQKVRLRTAVRTDLTHKLHCCFILDVQKSHFRTLFGELLHDLFADTTSPARHHHDSITQARVGSVFHLFFHACLPVFCHPKSPPLPVVSSRLHVRRSDQIQLLS